MREELEQKGPDHPDIVQEDLWPRGWAGHRRAQFRHSWKTSLPDQIAWLEETQPFAEQLARSRRLPEHR